MQLNAPRKITSSTRLYWSSVMRWIMASRVNPALLTRMSIRPHFDAAFAMMDAAVAGSATLPNATIASPPVCNRRAFDFRSWHRVQIVDHNLRAPPQPGAARWRGQFPGPSQ